MRIRTIALCLVLGLAAAPAAALPAGAAAGFSDLDADWDWAEEGVQYLVKQGVISGFPDGTFRPAEEVTRGQFIHMLTLLCRLPKDVPVADYPDTEDHWAGPAVRAAVKYGIVPPAEAAGRFRPDEPATRLEMAEFIVRAMYGGTPPRVDADHAPFDDILQLTAEEKNYVAAAVIEEIITGYPDDTFRPGQTAGRAEAAVMIDRMARGEISGAALDLAEVLADAPQLPTIGDHWILPLQENHFIALATDPGEVKPNVTVGLDAALVNVQNAGEMGEVEMGEFIYVPADALEEFAGQKYPDGIYIANHMLGDRPARHVRAPQELPGPAAFVQKVSRLYPERIIESAAHWGLELAEDQWIFWRKPAAGKPDFTLAFGAQTAEFTDVSPEMQHGGVTLLAPEDFWGQPGEELPTGVYVIPTEASELE